ncbi:MAG: DUF2087 domain-containing protein [FCB group bacterium]|nr:DUF2087 domain-containing protein [FCB group bacterium]
MKEFKDMRFYSTAELAEKLNMNIQVIARKLQAGEIDGHKIGKDWRVEEDAVQKWLEKISNKNRVAITPREKVLKNFFKGGKLTVLPAQRKKRIYVLEHFLQMFDLNRSYTEAEVNETIKRHYDDFCIVRREMVDGKMMMRKAGNYRRLTTYQIIDKIPKPKNT